MKSIESERLILRPMIEEDAEFILELLNDPSFIRNIGDRKVRSLDDAKDYISKGSLTSYEKNGFGLLTVTLKETRELMGICGLIKRETLEDVDIGYAFLPRYWLKGFAVEAALAVKQFARDAIGLKRLVAIVNPDNEASIRVLEKIGMHFVKMVKSTGEPMELKLFSVDLWEKNEVGY